MDLLGLQPRHLADLAHGPADDAVSGHRDDRAQARALTAPPATIGTAAATVGVVARTLAWPSFARGMPSGWRAR